MRSGAHTLAFACLVAACHTAACNTIEVRRAPIPITQPAEQPVHAPDPDSAQPAPPSAPSDHEPPPLSESEAVALLRGHLLQLLPCEAAAGTGQVQVHAVLAEDGAVLALRAGQHTLSREAVRCVLSRVPWWRFPAGAGQRSVSLTLTFPLQPPSINDHQAVLLPGGGQIDLGPTTAELRKLRGKVMACYDSRKPDTDTLLLVWLRLGEWGKLLDSGVEADTGNPGKFQQAQEKACLHRVLRYGEFPNPTGEVELRFPYVLAR